MAERPWRDRAAAVLVTLALAAMVFRAGTFHHGAAAASLVTGAVLLLTLAFRGAVAFRDPLALAAAGAGWWRWLLPALWMSVTASWLLSPVGRAGESIVLFLLPAVWASAGAGFVLARPAARRWALAGCAAVAVAASSWALIQQPLHEQGRAALPIGHHNQLALVLVALLPSAVLGVWRLAGSAGLRLRLAAALGVSSLVIWTVGATGSLSGLLALALQALAAAAWTLWRCGGRRWFSRAAASLGLLAALACAAAWAGVRLDVPGPVDRLGAVLRLEDPSLLARRTYAAAALRGFAERPVLGWGPGASSWTLARHWRPAPGVHPPGEVVTDSHSLLAQTLYEVGVVGSLLLLAVIGRYGQRRVVELLRASARARAAAGSGAGFRSGGEVRDPELLAAALLGLLGAGSCVVFGVFAVVTAVPAVLILNLGLAAAARCGGPVPEGWRSWPRLRGRVVLLLWLTAAFAWSLERAWAARLYERAIAASPGGELQDGVVADETARRLRAAAAADPRFPLYQVRLDARSAAEAASGLAPLWLLAGVDEDADTDRRRAALERACDLDPLSALAPFELMRLEREGGAPASARQVSVRAAWAILAEPRLLAALAFEGDPDLRIELHRQIRAWPGLPSGWLAAFEELWFELDWSNGGEGPPHDVLSIDADRRAAVSFSLFAFRRPPWPLSIGAAPLRSSRLAAIVAHDLPAATRLPGTEPDPFWRRLCGLGNG